MLLHKQQSTDVQSPLSVVDNQLQTSTVSDFHLFRHLKESLRGRAFEDDEDVTVAVNECTEEGGENFFLEGIKTLEQRWALCVALRGNNVEKHLNDFDVSQYFMYFSHYLLNAPLIMSLKVVSFNMHCTDLLQSVSITNRVNVTRCHNGVVRHRHFHSNFSVSRGDSSCSSSRRRSRSSALTTPSSNTYVSRLKPNSITLASSELAPNMFEAGSCQIPLH